MYWPGAAAEAIDWISDLHGRWKAVLDGCAEADLDEEYQFGWPERRPLASAAAWVNGELTKNIAEIGVLRHTWLALGRP